MLWKDKKCLFQNALSIFLSMVDAATFRDSLKDQLIDCYSFLYHVILQTISVLKMAGVRCKPAAE
jgi:hypothetical protein